MPSLRPSRQRPLARKASRLLAGLAAVTLVSLAGCAVQSPPAAVAPNADVAEPLPAWVELGPAPVARAVVPAGAGCPELTADGQPRPMVLRVAAATVARRPTANDPGGPAKPFAFPVDVCEASVAQGVHDLRLGDRALPAVAAQPRRIVVLGDTGCRLKGPTVQSCNDPAHWPFAQVARSAAALRPDLVVHVGDYHYRETPCPAGVPGCAGSPWGYGWDVWQADFFTPARPLLAAAAWVFVRGNHEECARAGQGWFRLLAPEPWTSARSCDLAADDDDANFSPPYAVPLGPGLQLLVFDSAAAGWKPLDRSHPHDAAAWNAYEADWHAIATLAARPGVRSVFVSHHPVLGFAPDPRTDATEPFPGTAALLETMRARHGTAYYPPGIALALHGHVHLFEALGFDDGHPATIVAGQGGDLRDPRLPEPLPPDATPAPGVRLAQMTTSDAFGFLLLERTDTGPAAWNLTAYRADASVLTRCTIGDGGALACMPAGALH
jgi:hypothetical protein